MHYDDDDDDDMFYDDSFDYIEFVMRFFVRALVVSFLVIVDAGMLAWILTGNGEIFVRTVLFFGAVLFAVVVMAGNVRSNEPVAKLPHPDTLIDDEES